MNLACVAEGVCPKCGTMMEVCTSCEKVAKKEPDEFPIWGVCSNCPCAESSPESNGDGRDHYRCSDNEVSYFPWSSFEEITVPLNAAWIEEEEEVA